MSGLCLCMVGPRRRTAMTNGPAKRILSVWTEHTALWQSIMYYRPRPTRTRIPTPVRVWPEVDRRRLRIDRRYGESSVGDNVEES